MTKILVADDDADNRTIARTVLEAAGYEVMLASDGEEALGTIRAKRPAVVVMDLSMPKMTGWEVAKRVRGEAGIDRTVLIAFTAHALVGERLKAEASGCDDYLAKPCEPKELVAKVRQWTDKESL